MEKDDNLNLTLITPIWELVAKNELINATFFLFALIQQTKQTFHEVTLHYQLKGNARINSIMTEVPII